MIDKRVSNKTAATTVATFIVALAAWVLNEALGWELTLELQGSAVLVVVFLMNYFIPADKGKYVDTAAEVVNVLEPAFPGVFDNDDYDVDGEPVVDPDDPDEYDGDPSLVVEDTPRSGPKH